MPAIPMPSAIPAAPAEAVITMTKRPRPSHRTKKDGTPITDVVVEQLADEAERGYDVEEVPARRRGGRPAMGSAPAAVESVRLDPELKRELLLRAARDGISVSEVIRHALCDYVRAG